MKQEPGRCLHRLTDRYTYVVPTSNLLTVLCSRAPIVELGAGTGYWAYLLRQMDVDIIAYDLVPPGGAIQNTLHKGGRQDTPEASIKPRAVHIERRSR